MKTKRMDGGVVAGIIAIGALILFATVAVMLVQPQQLKTTTLGDGEAGEVTGLESEVEFGAAALAPTRYVCRCKCQDDTRLLLCAIEPDKITLNCPDYNYDFDDEGSAQACKEKHTGNKCEGYLRARPPETTTGTLTLCKRIAVVRPRPTSTQEQ